MIIISPLMFRTMIMADGTTGYACREDLTRQLAEVAAALVAATQAQNLAAIQATNSVGQAAQEIASETRADVNRIDGDIRLSQSESESRLTLGVAGVGTRVETNGGDTRTAIERNSSEIRQNISDGNAETRRDISDAQMTIHSTLEDRTTELRLSQAQNFSTTLLEIERAKFATVESRCSLERQAAESLASIQLEAAKNVAAIQLEASRNKYDLASKMDDCCCEIKQLVSADGERTRSLIEKSEINRLREALENARRDSDHHRNNDAIRINIENTLRNSSPIGNAYGSGNSRAAS